MWIICWQMTNMKYQKVSKSDQEMTQSHTADHPTAPGGRDTNMAAKRQSKATSSLFLSEMFAKLERTLSTA